jgi:hypothetical protein
VLNRFPERKTLSGFDGGPDDTMAVAVAVIGI